MPGSVPPPAVPAVPAAPVSRPVDPPIDAPRLRDIGLFGALSDEVLGHLAKILKAHRIEAGEMIFREGDAAREMYVILDGEMEVLKKSRRGREQRVAILGPTDTFGEMSILDMQARSASVRALGPSRILRLSTEDMDGLYRHDLKSYTLIILNIAREVSRRLRVTDSILADFTASVLDEYLPGSKARR